MCKYVKLTKIVFNFSYLPGRHQPITTHNVKGINVHVSFYPANKDACSLLQDFRERSSPRFKSRIKKSLFILIQQGDEVFILIVYNRLLDVTWPNISEVEQNQNKNKSPESETNTEWSKSRWQCTIPPFQIAVYAPVLRCTSGAERTTLSYGAAWRPWWSGPARDTSAYGWMRTSIRSDW